MESVFDLFLEFINTKETTLDESKLLVELRSNLKLATFLFRSGRTSETGWRSDSSYNQRSQYIYKTIALELGFNPQLIDTITLAFDFDFHVRTCNKSLIEGMALSTFKKILRYFQLLLQLTHTLESIRYNTNSTGINEKVSKQLSYLGINHDEIDACSKKLISLAERFCRETGTGIAYKFAQGDISAGCGNPYQLTASSNDISGSYLTLHRLYQERIEAMQTSEEIKPSHKLRMPLP